MRFFFFLSLFIFVSCSQSGKKAGSPLSEFKINLGKLSSDDRFKAIANDQFVLAEAGGSEVKILRYQFESPEKLQSYLLNRRMLLHREFQNNIAPYVGMLEMNQTCLSYVDSKGEIQETAEMSFLTMRFPVTSSFVISECLRNDVWGLLDYRFYHCKKSNLLFEIRHRHPLNEKDIPLSVSCGSMP
jgi:hypothetical protein